ncbi:MAG: hypothetical protein QOK13_585, partial [Gaiellaceae bacterium]|nr:hypothetical protein [Gaiellaceae bacterium]
GRRRVEEAEPPLLEAEPEPEPEPESESESEPEQAYVDPWERDFEYPAPEEPENVVEPEETPPEETTEEETTEEPLAAERNELALDEGESNGSPLEEPDELPGRTAPRRPEYVPRRGRRR